MLYFVINVLFNTLFKNIKLIHTSYYNMLLNILIHNNLNVEQCDKCIKHGKINANKIRIRTII